MERHLTAPLTPADLEDAAVKSPGRYAYSSSAYVVLKLVIEKVSGEDYASRLQGKILDPAGMGASGLMRKGKTVPGLSLGYKTAKDAAPTTPSWPIELFDGAGSLYTTAGDLAAFDAALASGRLLSPATQKVMYTRHTEGGTPWAYGWALGEQGGKLFPWHKGDINGYTAAFVRQVHRGEVIVILSNLEGADLTPLRQKILRVLKDAAEP
jgi:CubicO group peptidase (beta-lactamase class C family)